jgi:hypothetical protein
LRIRLVAAEKDEEYEQKDENPPTTKKYGAAFCFRPFCFRCHLENPLSIFAVSLQESLLQSPITL